MSYKNECMLNVKIIKVTLYLDKTMRKRYILIGKAINSCILFSLRLYRIAQCFQIDFPETLTTVFISIFFYDIYDIEHSCYIAVLDSRIRGYVTLNEKSILIPRYSG